MLTVYKASAGSGKTFTLTREYIKLLLGYRNPETGRWTMRQKPDHANRSILAITFTNKATEEMTKRIIKELAILARREPSHTAESPYLKDFCKLFGESEERIRELASLTLDDLLADFLFFHVSTIDAFFQTVLRIFAREVEMPDDFQLELDSNYTIAIGVNEMFSSINLGEPIDPLLRKEYQWLTGWLTRMLERSFDDGNAVNLFARRSGPFNQLIGFFGRLMSEDFKFNSKRIIDYLSDINRLIAFEKALNSAAQSVNTRITDAARRLMQYGDYPNVNNHVRSRCESWAAGNMLPPSDSINNAITDPAKRYYANYYRAGNIPADFDAAVVDMCTVARQGFKFIDFRNAVLKSINSFGLLGYLLRFVTDYCKNNNVLMLSETNSLLRDIINDDDTPFVYERLGYYLRHFLIDEFQDTSRMQWDNLRPLIMESLSHKHSDLVIGDEKQCIYRFRNSDPELLGHEIADQVQSVYGPDAVSIEGNTVTANNNWRSAREVVMFNNSLFHAMAQAIGDDAATYSGVIQQISPHRNKEIPGHVSLIFEPPKDAPAKPDSSDLSDESDEPQNDDFPLDMLESEVRRMLSAGYNPEDITVLVRTHTEGERCINRLLAMQTLPDWPYPQFEVSSSDAMKVTASPAVRMVIEVLRLTQMPQVVERAVDGQPGSTQTVVNPAYRRTRLHYCFEYYLHLPVTEPDGTTRARTYNEAIVAAIEALRSDAVAASADSDAIAGVSREIWQLLDFTKTHLKGSHVDATPPDNASHRSDDTLSGPTLSTLIDDIIARFVAPEALPRETAFLTAFQDLVYDFCQSGNSDVRSFLEWWDRSGSRSSLTSADETKALMVMTIHQSKGLEFPCVIMPYANWNLVTYNSSRRPVTRWFTLSPDDFPDIPADLVPPMMPFDFTKALGKIDYLSPQVNRLEKQQRIDSLNVAYVAFTRAVNELSIIVPSIKGDVTKDGAIQTLRTAMQRSIDSLTHDAILTDPSLSDDSRKWVLPLGSMMADGHIEIGTPTIPTRQQKAEKPTTILPTYNPAVNNNLLTLTKADIAIFDYNNPRHRGDFLHYVMARVRHADSLPRAMARAAYRARLTPQQKAECEALLSEALADQRVKPWFEGYKRVLSERTIALGDHNYRPDRVVWTADGHIDIIDFKFGEPQTKYIKQVARYMELMRLAGYTGLRGFLWYVDRHEIVNVKL